MQKPAPINVFMNAKSLYVPDFVSKTISYSCDVVTMQEQQLQRYERCIPHTPINDRQKRTTRDKDPKRTQVPLTVMTRTTTREADKDCQFCRETVSNKISTNTFPAHVHKKFLRRPAISIYCRKTCRDTKSTLRTCLLYTSPSPRD